MITAETPVQGNVCSLCLVKGYQFNLEVCVNIQWNFDSQLLKVPFHPSLYAVVRVISLSDAEFEVHVSVCIWVFQALLYLTVK